MTNRCPATCSTICPNNGKSVFLGDAGGEGVDGKAAA
jgi:hypothetical protein